MNQIQLIMPQLIYSKIIEHCRDSLPNESCGLLTGNDNHVNRFWPLDNELKSTKLYFVSKRSLEKVLTKINQTGEQVLAIYHTHPTTAPVPSYYDLQNHPDETVQMMIISFKTEPPKSKIYTIKNRLHSEGLIILKFKK
ncbi:proteasome lid subunit RPN8/RPN11 [Alkalibacillus flavidus]|uniref:Proteasome lid subunit RPN8/RPN11 n=1 Tax=Alkalibacillus flavidus TaxID=546021 RepID=A0ABV2KVW8_9BACI